jgi:hypothetical protein
MAGSGTDDLRDFVTGAGLAAGAGFEGAVSGTLSGRASAVASGGDAFDLSISEWRFSGGATGTYAREFLPPISQPRPTPKAAPKAIQILVRIPIYDFNN